MKELAESSSPKDKRDIKLVVNLNRMDMQALESGMARVGEVSKSIYIRRLIHDHVIKK